MKKLLLGKLVLAGPFLLLSSAAGAAVSMQGTVTLDYYVADVDADGFDRVESEIAVDHVVNDGAGASGPLALSGWLTQGSAPGGPGTEAGYVALGPVPGNSSLDNVDEIVTADDAAPGEYYPHVLLQDENFPGTFEDARNLVPRVLWRGGLEAIGPLHLRPYAAGTQMTVDFSELRNNRIDNRYTNDIVLTLYATRSLGPSSAGYTLCSTTVSGIYAGDHLTSPGFSCALNAVPDGDYTVHLDVAESGGRGGYSTLSGPDVSFRGGYIDDGACCGYDYYVAGALSPTTLAILALLLPLRRRGRGRGGSAPIHAVARKLAA